MGIYQQMMKQQEEQRLAEIERQNQLKLKAMEDRYRQQVNLQTQQGAITGQMPSVGAPGAGVGGYVRPMDTYQEPKKYNATITQDGMRNAQSRFLQRNYGGR